ncbi:MAG: hypothetical protein QMC59_01565 [Candidatus Poseidoniaceae archaeon]
MSSRSPRAVAFVFILVMASLAPLAMPASAHSAILLDVDTHHAVLQAGESTNVTLEIENNGSSIESYNISIDSSGLSAVWAVNASEDVVSNVFPTWSRNTTVVIQLSTGAVPADSGSFNVHVTEPDQGITSMITVYVSVAPSYSPLLGFDTMGTSLAMMDAGATENYTIDVTNAGSVSDTLLLDVEYEPDLSAWWIAQSANNTGGNNTGGNNTGGNNTGGNNTGGNNTGGNNTGGNNTTSLSNVMMYGNSYTSVNSLNALLESMGVLNADAITPGGRRLAQHWDDVNTSGHVSNTTLRDANIDWDYVVLQDQSQVPGFNRTTSSWIASKDGAVHLAQAIDDEGSESVLFMTWGRRNGDPLNPMLYSNFTVMQDRLTSGYLDYQSNMTATGATVWVAPVGLAFKHIHDEVMAGGVNASMSGNLFYDLYGSDGSHPSLAGSYLAACVLHATMTGTSPVGSNDTVALNSTIKLQLQQAAAATVFNETSQLDYPWSSSITAASSSRGLGGGIPAGWNVQWVDDQFDNMGAGSSQQATLQVTVPADVVPDYYGFRLFAGSTQGNISTSTLIVVHVDEEHNLGLVWLAQEADFIPGTTVSTTVQVTNTGNAQVDYDWNLSEVGGPCTFSLPSASTLDFAPNAVIDLAIQVDVESTATTSDSCDFHLSGSTPENLGRFSEGATFTLQVDELIVFDLDSSVASIEVTPGTTTAYEIHLTNNGSEERTFVLQILGHSNLSTQLTSQSEVLVAAGDVGIWSLETTAQPDVVGFFAQSFEVVRGGVTATTSIDVEVLPTTKIELSGPLDGRILVQPGGESSTMFTLVNTGTGNVSVVASLSGLPASVQAEISQTSMMLEVGASAEVYLNLSLANNAQPATHPITFGFGGSGATATQSIDVQIQDRFSVLVTSANDAVVAGPSNNASVMFDVTNLGTSTDIIQFNIVDDGDMNWFSYSLSTTSVSIEAGATSTVVLTVREMATGAPLNGVTIALRASSGNDGGVEDHRNITVRPQVAGAEITVIADDDQAQPGESIRGTVVVQNTGTGMDQLLLTTVGMDCGVTGLLNLEAGASSSAVAWSCLINEDAQSGLGELKFRVTSSARSEYVQSYTEIYTVEPSWDADNILAITTNAQSYGVPYSGGTTIVVTVTNLANTQVSGVVDYGGDGSAMLIAQWSRYIDNESTTSFVLAPFATVEYELTLTSDVQAKEVADLFIKATFTIDATSTTASSQSPAFAVKIAGPAEPPQGVTLPLGFQLDQSTTLNALFGGWGFALLLALVLYVRRPGSETDEDDSETTEEVLSEEKGDQADLGYNECRMEAGKVSCPSCEARLGVPRSSEPPFRFTCPKCQTMIRVIE